MTEPYIPSPVVAKILADNNIVMWHSLNINFLESFDHPKSDPLYKQMYTVINGELEAAGCASGIKRVRALNRLYAGNQAEIHRAKTLMEKVDSGDFGALMDLLELGDPNTVLVEAAVLQRMLMDAIDKLSNTVVEFES